MLDLAQSPRFGNLDQIGDLFNGSYEHVTGETF